MGGAYLLSMLVQEIPAESNWNLAISSRPIHWDTTILRGRGMKNKMGRTLPFLWWIKTSYPPHFPQHLTDL